MAGDTHMVASLAVVFRSLRRQGNWPRALSAVALVLQVCVGVCVASAAVSTCNGQPLLNYAENALGIAQYVRPYDVVRPFVQLDALTMTNASMLFIKRLRWAPNCINNVTVGCIDAGPITAYEGDQFISTNCLDEMGNPVTWSTGIAAGYTGNDLVLWPSAMLAVPANTHDGCKVAWNEKVISLPPSGALSIQQNTGFDQIGGQWDAWCNNMVQSKGLDNTTLPLCPTCPPGTVCDQETDVCMPGPTPTPSTTHWQCDVCRQMP